MPTIEHHSNGKIYRKFWTDDNMCYHRINGPAYCEYYSNGNPRLIKWCINGIPHRYNGPAEIKYDINYGVITEQWFVNGKYHREDGPTLISYNKNGNITQKEYWWNGHKITDFIEKLFECVPDELTKEEQILLKLSLPNDYFSS